MFVASNVDVEKWVDFKVKNELYECVFWLSRDEIERTGLEITVFGKRIVASDFFGLDYQIKPSYRRRIHGIIYANPLASLLNTPKTDFRTSVNPQLWSTFRKQVYILFKRKSR